MSGCGRNFCPRACLRSVIGEIEEWNKRNETIKGGKTESGFPAFMCMILSYTNLRKAVDGIGVLSSQFPVFVIETLGMVSNKEYVE